MGKPFEKRTPPKEGMIKIEATASVVETLVGIADQLFALRREELEVAQEVATKLITAAEAVVLCLSEMESSRKKAREAREAYLLRKEEVKKKKKEGKPN